MKREPDFAIISRIEVGVREPGVDTPNLSGQVVVFSDDYLGECVGARKGEGSPESPQTSSQHWPKQAGREGLEGRSPNNPPKS